MSTSVSTARINDSNQQVSRWERFAPLSGVAFFLLLLISAVSGGETPSEYASGATVLSLFGADAGAHKVSHLIEALSVVFLLFFASWLRDYVRSRGAGPHASAVFGGAVVIAVGGEPHGLESVGRSRPAMTSSTRLCHRAKRATRWWY